MQIFRTQTAHLYYEKEKTAVIKCKMIEEMIFTILVLLCYSSDEFKWSGDTNTSVHLQYS